MGIDRAESSRIQDVSNLSFSTKLAIPKSSEATTSTSRSIEDCVICLSTITAPAKAIPCQHSYFDFLCILTWLQNRPSCPLCKAAITSIQYNQTSDSEYDTYQVTPKTSAADSSAVLPGRRGSRTFRPRINDIRSSRSHCSRDIVRPRDENEALARRRHVYKHQLYSLHVGSNRLSAYQDLTREKFRNDEHLVRRAKKWIRRELQVFSYLGRSSNSEESVAASSVAQGSSNAEFLLSYIIAILKTVDIQSAGGQAEDMLTDYLSRTDATLFLHELRAWLRSPYESLESWDSHVQYNRNSTSKHSETRRIRKADCWHPPRNQSSSKDRMARSHYRSERGSDRPG
jgi:hypothetical protein